mmetsp:Transcript_42070/g.64491  ORF Transcript_42070/g.64491 Transcript_42070/m.64491 type:complete len:254 (-) Transcript_42070:211-972(-)
MPTSEQLKIWQFCTTTRLSRLLMRCMEPCLKLEKRQLEIWTFEFIAMTPEVWSVSLPMNSQPIKLNDELGKLTRATNFWFKWLGIDFRVSVHSRKITPPELMQKMESMLRAMSNSYSDLTQALGRYLTSCWASLNFSESLIPEWAKIIRLKLISWPFFRATLITGPVLPMIITFESLSYCSMVIPCFVIGFSQVYTPYLSRIMQWSSALSRASSRLLVGPRSGSTSMIPVYSKFRSISSYTYSCERWRSLSCL